MVEIVLAAQRDAGKDGQIKERKKKRRMPQNEAEMRKGRGQMVFVFAYLIKRCKESGIKDNEVINVAYRNIIAREVKK